MNLAQRIRRARKLVDISQAELARRMNVDRSCVGHWEGVHHSHPGHVRLAELATLLTVSYEWLATGRGEMKLAHDPADDIPASFGRLVDDPDTLRLLKAWEQVPARSRGALLEIVEQLSRLRKPKAAKETSSVKLNGGLYDLESGRPLKT